MAHSAIVVGASGYSGLELTRLLDKHPKVELTGASSERWAGRALADALPGASSKLNFEKHQLTLERAESGFAFFCTPNETSLALVPELVERGVRVIDLSGAFRLETTGLYREWYGFEHKRQDLLNGAVYGLPELYGVPKHARLVANPGCYATAAQLAVGPLLDEGLVDTHRAVVLDGKSGVTGAGRSLSDSLLFSEVAESVRPYKVGKHQHTPEIERFLSTLSERSVQVSLTTHLIPIRRGLVVTGYLTAAEGTTQTKLDDALRARYESAPLIRVLRDRVPETRPLVGTPFCDVAARLDVRTNTIVAFCALDNLLKGAASQAVQNLNALLGFPTETGLLETS